MIQTKSPPGNPKRFIQALERTRANRPLAPGNPVTQTHDYTRHGATTLFAGLDVLASTVLGGCMQRHRNGEFIRFLNAVESAVPPGKAIHAILDNVATHKHPKVRAWLVRPPRWAFHFSPTSASWLNAVQGFFSAFTRRRLRRGSFTGVVDLQAAIKRYIAEHNRRAQHFIWAKLATDILAAVSRSPEPSVRVSALGAAPVSTIPRRVRSCRLGAQDRRRTMKELEAIGLVWLRRSGLKLVRPLQWRHDHRRNRSRHLMNGHSRMLNGLLALTAISLAALTPAVAFDIKNSTTSGANPSLATHGEIAINRADKRLIFKNVEGTLGYGSLLNTLPSVRKAVEAGDGFDLSVALSTGQGAILAALFGDAGRSAFFGVKCDGAAGTDNTAAINTMTGALADVTVPPGVCRIKGKLLIPAGHVLRGSGRFATTFAVGPDFDMAAEAVIKFGGLGTRLFDVTMDFAQPDSGARSDWTRYPTAISTLGSGGQWEIDRVRVQRATKTLDMRGEQGQSRIGLLETSFLEMGVDIDGSRDSVHIGTLRFWSYGFTPNQYGVVIDGNTTVNGGLGPIGLNSGRMDGLIIDELFCIFWPKAVRFYYSKGYQSGPELQGITTALINKLQFDTTGGFFCEWCDVNVAGAYINLGAPGFTGIVVRGGAVNFGQLNIATFGTADFKGRPFPATDIPIMKIDNNTTQPKVTIAGFNVDLGDKDRTLLQTGSPNGGNGPPILNIAAMSVRRDSGKAYTKPIFDMPVGIGGIFGLTVADLTSGSGTIFNAPNDIPMTVLIPPTTGWMLGVPNYFQKFTVNFGFSGGSLTLPLGTIYAGGTITSGGAVVAVGGIYTGRLASPAQVIDPNGGVKAIKFGANGAAPTGKCTLSGALATDGSATNAAIASAINALRSCGLTNGLAQ